MDQTVKFVREVKWSESAGLICISVLIVHCLLGNSLCIKCRFSITL